MKCRYIFRLLSALLVMQLISMPVIAQNWQNRQLPTMGTGENKPSSFRPDKNPEAGSDTMMPQVPSSISQGWGMMSPEMQALQYQVHVVGEVNKPGTYRVTASERLSEVINRAGGIIEQGSKRNIQIKRKGVMSAHVDLLKFELYGDLNNNPFVMDNDVIYVPLKKGSIQIVGAVKRPLVYELSGEKNVKDAIALAGGFNSGTAVTDPVRVIRYENGEKKVYEIPNEETELSKFNILGGDVITVSSVVTSKHKFDYNVASVPGDNVFYPSYEDRVFVLGGVNSPGAYDWNPYYTVQQYVTMAGGMTQLAKNKITIISSEGKKKKMTNKNISGAQVNPGDTVMVASRRLAPESWVSLFMAVAGFGLSATATVVTLTNK